MERITYISAAATAPDRAMVDDILRVSRRNNRRDGLTGLLVVCGRRFLQVIEGPRAMTDLTYNRIRGDRRHVALVELSRKRITERAFAAWDMGCEHLDGEDYDEAVRRILHGIDDPELEAHFTSFLELHRKAA